MVTERIPRAFGLDPLRDVQVLSPMHRGAAGTEGLNRALQEALDPVGRRRSSCRRGAARARLRVGDKVMQLRNDYDRDVFNGDIGVVVGARRRTSDDEADVRIDVDFDGRRVRLRGRRARRARARLRGQRAQEPGLGVPGGRGPALLPAPHDAAAQPPLHRGHARASSLVVLVAEPRALRRAVAPGGPNGDAGTVRDSGLAARLRGRQVI